MLGIRRGGLGNVLGQIPRPRVQIPLDGNELLAPVHVRELFVAFAHTGEPSLPEPEDCPIGGHLRPAGMLGHQGSNSVRLDQAAGCAIGWARCRMGDAGHGVRCAGSGGSRAHLIHGGIVPR